MNFSETTSCGNGTGNTSSHDNGTWRNCSQSWNNVKTGAGHVPEIGVQTLIISIAIISVSLWPLVQICRHRELHTPVNKLMASLCACACLNGLLGLAYVWPYELIPALQSCLVFSCVYCATFIVTFLHFMAISIERYLHIVHPFLHFRLTENNRSLVICLIVVWSTSFLLAFSPMYVTLKPGWSRFCLQMPFTLPFWLFTLIYVGILLSATTTVGITYSRIFKVALKHMRAIEQLGHAAGCPSTDTHTGITQHQSERNAVKHQRTKSADIWVVTSAGSCLKVNKDSRCRGDDVNDCQIDAEVGTSKDIYSVYRGDSLNGCSESNASGSREDNAICDTSTRDKTTKGHQKLFQNGSVCQNVVVTGSTSRKQTSKLRSAVPFVVLYIYYFMSWAPNTVVKTYTSYTDKLFEPVSLDKAVNIITMVSPIGHCFLYMYLERDVRQVTLNKLFGLLGRSKVRSSSTDSQEVNDNTVSYRA